MPKYLMAYDRRILKERLCEAQNWHCCYCGRIVSNDPKDKFEPFHATFDHVEPMAKYRQNYRDRWYHSTHYDKNYWNYEILVIACNRCNNIRKATDAFDFYYGELWKPENRLKLKLWHMKRFFVDRGDIGTLRAMGDYCECDKHLSLVQR